MNHIIILKHAINLFKEHKVNRMRKKIKICFLAIIMVSCTNSKTKEIKAIDLLPTTEEYDPNRGVGKFENIELDQLNPVLASKGKNIAEIKCLACHKLTEEKLVGPGWKGVTSRHKPEWILNFITNPDAMIDKDPKLQAQLEICLVRMPNQDLTDDAAFSLLEFMRQNDEK